MQDHRRNTVPAHLRNLRPPWKPGESGNPDGRPKGTVNLLDRIRRQLLEVPEGGREAFADAAAKAYVEAMARGSIRHIRDFLDREEGRAVQPLRVEAPDAELVPMDPARAVEIQRALLAQAGLVQLRLTSPPGDCSPLIPDS